MSALPQVETPGWEAPVGEELATIYSDTYKLGLIALRLLGGDQDIKNPRHLGSTTPALVRQIITDTLTHEPQQRPLPEGWTSEWGIGIRLGGVAGVLAIYPQSPAAQTSTPMLDPESASLQQLQLLASGDRSFVSSALASRWIPQLSSKRPGIVDDGVVWDKRADVVGISSAAPDV